MLDMHRRKERRHATKFSRKRQPSFEAFADAFACGWTRSGITRSTGGVDAGTVLLVWAP